MIMNGASDWNCELKTACIGGKEMIVNYMIGIVAQKEQAGVTHWDVNIGRL